MTDFIGERDYSPAGHQDSFSGMHGRIICCHYFVDDTGDLSRETAIGLCLTCYRHTVRNYAQQAIKFTE